MGDGAEKPALQVIVLVSLPIVPPVVRPCSIHADLYMSFMLARHPPPAYEWTGSVSLFRGSFFSVSVTVHFVSGWQGHAGLSSSVLECL